MNTRVGRRSGSCPMSVPAHPATAPAVERTAPPSSTQPERVALTANHLALEARLHRDVAPMSTAVPMCARLARAVTPIQTAHEHVGLLFESAAKGEPLPLDTAEDTVGLLLDTFDDDATALTSLVRLKAHDDYARMHSVAVAVLMASLARAMRLDEAQRREAALAGLLHDIGKAFVPAHLLAKPGRLTQEEFALVRNHPQAGFEALGRTAGMPDAPKSVARHHHERPDGCGYPDRLAGPQIPMLARMGAVCDVYDAVTSNRPYKDGWPPTDALHAMARWTRDGQFDVRVMANFSSLMGPHPIGSLVRLRSQRLGVVNAAWGATSTPLSVTAFFCLRSRRAVSPEIVTVGARSSADAIVGSESNVQWRFRGLDALWAGALAARLQPPRTPLRGWASAHAHG